MAKEIWKSIHLGQVPRKMIKFNPGLSQLLARFSSLRTMHLDLKKSC